MKIFLDTTVFINLYQASSISRKDFDQIRKHKSAFVITPQVKREYERQRERSLNLLIREFQEVVKASPLKFGIAGLFDGSEEFEASYRSAKEIGITMGNSLKAMQSDRNLDPIASLVKELANGASLLEENASTVEKASSDLCQRGVRLSSSVTRDGFGGR